MSAIQEEAGDANGRSVEKPPAEAAAAEPGCDLTGSQQEGGNWLHGSELVVLVASLMTGIFMVGLDGQILATVLPSLTTEFDSLDDLVWYGSIYQLAQIALQPTFGKAYTFLNTKRMYLSALLLFEAGSVVCATAPSSAVFIFGRALTGAASSAIFAGDQTIFVHSVRLRQRPIAMSCLSVSYAVASLLGPPLGGLITDSPKLTWRFCFWINLPFGALTALAIQRAYKPSPGVNKNLPTAKKLGQLDLVGTLLFVATVVTLFLALQWGGVAYPWSDSRVWGCLVGAALLLLAFVGSQVFNQAQAMIQRRVISRRTVLISCLFISALQMSIVVQTYYLPIWFQAVLRTSASGSGERILPYTIVGTPTTLITGLLMSKTGQYAPFMPLGSAILTLGTALFSLLAVESAAWQFIAFESVAALGFGIATQIAIFAVQNVLPAEDAPMGISLVIFSQGLGAALGLSIAQSVFVASLDKGLEHISGLAPEAVLHAGASASGLRNSVPSALLASVLDTYDESLKPVWALAAAAAGSALLCSLFVPWKRVSKE